MNKVRLKGSKKYIYYDIKKGIIGRELTKSNVQENGADNSLYFGLGNQNMDDIIISIFCVEDINKLIGKKIKLKLCDIFVEFEFNINDRKQRQLKMLSDLRQNKGRINRAIKYYKEYTNSKVLMNNIVFLLDLKNHELLIKNNHDILAENEEFEKTVKSIIDDAKKNGIKVEDLEGYISTYINARNSAVQKRFKDELMSEFNGKCALCAVNKKELLIASHILPYHKCPTVNEMIDKNNGLLLCITHDALFDKKYISFDQEGKIIISKEIDEKMYELLNIKKGFFLDSQFLTDSRIRYIATHKVKKI